MKRYLIALCLGALVGILSNILGFDLKEDPLQWWSFVIPATLALNFLFNWRL